MGKILPKKKFFKSAIYTPHLPVGSHIDNVKYSLEHLIFSNTKEVEHTLLIKRIKVVALTTILLMIIGSFLSPKGQAEVATFYPSSCLGGWNNPRNAEGEPQVGISGDASEFNVENSAMLAKETSADIYCGSFVGKIEQNTKPIKMVVSFSWSAKDILVHGKQLEVSSSTESVDIGTTTASTTVLLASSTEIVTSSTTETVEGATSTVSATTTEESSSTLDKVVSLVQDVFGKVFGGNDTASTTQATSTVEASTSEPTSTTTTEVTPIKTDTGEVPVKAEEKVPETAPAESAPTSFLHTFIQKIAGRVITKVFAEEIIKVVDATSTHEETSVTSTTSLATSTDITTASSSENASSTDAVTSTTTMPENTNNDFLEVLYTFDGVTWNSLGTVNESSIQYRTFEIPVTASTSWEDMGQLQIKVKPVQRIDEKPIVYLDGIKVEVLYETPLTHEHPDFLRDTILQDDIVKGVRILRIINNDTNKEEIWYMHPEEATSTDIGTTTPVIATSSESITASTTENNQNNTLEISSSTNATSTPNTGTSTPNEGDRIIKPFSIKNKWLKLDSTEVAAKGIDALLKEIDEQEKRQEYMYPDFTKDLIKQIQGGFLNRVFVQVEQMGTSTLWLFDTENDTQEKIDIDGKTTFSKTFPFGVKGDNVFWLSEDNLTLYVFNVITKEIQHKEIPEYDKSLGQRGEVTFETVPWKIIIGAQDFSFYSEETGEVFSDDDLTASEAFRVKEKLDTMLPKEKLEELELIVDEAKQQ